MVWHLGRSWQRKPLKDVMNWIIWTIHCNRSFYSSQARSLSWGYANVAEPGCDGHGPFWWLHKPLDCQDVGPVRWAVQLCHTHTCTWAARVSTEGSVKTCIWNLVCWNYMSIAESHHTPVQRSKALKSSDHCSNPTETHSQTCYNYIVLSMTIFTHAWISRITWAHQSMGLAAEVLWRRGSSMSWTI